MLKELRNNDRGVVFVTVLIVIITTMVLAISALSLNISQIKSTENELKYLQAKTLADGGLVRIVADQFSASPSTSDTYSETVGDTTFTVTSNIDTSGPGGPIGSNSVPLDIVVTF
jgi:hypothetical protein